MHRDCFLAWAIVFCGVAALQVCGDEPAREPLAEAAENPSVEETLSVEEIVQRVRPSLVTVSSTGRDAREQGVGTGFVVSSEGLIATNLHVIGEGREFTVELSDGTDLPVLSIEASDRHQDLAVIKVDPGSTKLAALELNEGGELPQGAAVVVMGNPLGLRNSVVSGVVSAYREIDGQRLLQLAIPIERGNSGGPVVDRQGRVHGVVNMKSLREQNVGFAVDVKNLRPLLNQPNPIPLSRWVTIGAIDESQWQPRMGARWRQRAGKILVSGHGAGFGGRSLCLSRQAPPELPFEVAVSVKLDDEAGAAGLIFHADGGDRHYGFYPTNGKLRLTCFKGPTVFTWKILQDVATEHYRPGDWNRLKVRVTEDKLACYVNDELVIESRDTTYSTGQVGLAKFRHTEAEFRRFQVAGEIASRQLASDEAERFLSLIDKMPALRAVRPDDLAGFDDKPAEAAELLMRVSNELEQRVEQLRKTANDVHVRGVTNDLAELASGADGEFDLLQAALLLAKLDEHDIDVEAYLAHVERMAREIRDGLDEDADDATRLAALNKYMFIDNGYHGSRNENYYHRANSYINRVIDDREGLPITLSVLYMELGRRLGLDLVGVGMPLKFLVGLRIDGEPTQLIDVFEKAQPLSVETARQVYQDLGGTDFQEEYLAPVSQRAVLVRILHNLINVAEPSGNKEDLLRYYEALTSLEPDSVRNRALRGMLRADTGRIAAALEDVDWILENAAEAVDVSALHVLRRRLLDQL